MDCQGHLLGAANPEGLDCGSSGVGVDDRRAIGGASVCPVDEA